MGENGLSEVNGYFRWQSDGVSEPPGTATALIYIRTRVAKCDPDEVIAFSGECETCCGELWHTGAERIIPLP